MNPTALLWSSSEKNESLAMKRGETLTTPISDVQAEEGSTTHPNMTCDLWWATIGSPEDDTRTQTRTNLHSCFGIPAPNGRKRADMWTTWRHTGHWESAPPHSWASSAEEENRPCPTSRLEEDQSPVYTKGSAGISWKLRLAFSTSGGRRLNVDSPVLGSPFYDLSSLYGFTIRFSKGMCRNLAS